MEKKSLISDLNEIQKTLLGSDVGADYSLESTGFFLTDETGRCHIEAVCQTRCNECQIKG